MLEEECSNSKIMKILNSTANEMDDMQKVLNTSFTAVYADAVIPGYSSRTGTDTKDIKLVSANYFGVSQPFHVPNLKQLNTGLYGRFHFYFPSALPETAFKEFKATAKNRFLSVEETLKEDENKMTNIFKESESFFIDSSDIEFSTDDEKKIYNEKIIYIGELLNDVSLGVLGNDEYTRLVKSTRQNNIIPYSYEEFSKYGENFELYEDYEFNEFVNRQKEFMKKTTSSEDEEKPQKTKEPNYKKIFQEVITNESFQNKLEEKYKQRFNLRIDVDLVGFLNHIEKKNDYEKDKHQRLLHKIVYMLSAFSIVLEKEKMLSAQTARCSSALYLAVTKLIFTQMEYFFDITTITGKADIAEADFREENKRQLQKALSLAKNFIAYRVRKALARSQDKTTISFQSFSKAAGIEDLTLKKRQELAEQAFLEVQKKLKKDKKIKATMSWSYKSPTCKLRVDDDFVITIS